MLCCSVHNGTAAARQRIWDDFRKLGRIPGGHLDANRGGIDERARVQGKFWVLPDDVLLRYGFRVGFDPSDLVKLIRELDWEAFLDS